MRCPQCGFEAVQGAAFCSRCGTRLLSPRPSAKREYALVRIFPSWWHFAREILLAVALAVGGVYVVFAAPVDFRIGIGVIAAAVLTIASTTLRRRNTSWSLTSDRLIERR